MTVYIENVIADNFALTYMISQVTYKLCGIFAKKRRSIFAAMVGTAVALVYPLIENNFLLVTVKIALYSVMCVILYTGKNKPIAAAVFLLVTAAFGGIMFFLMYSVCGNVDRALRGGINFSPGIAIFAGYAIYKITCRSIVAVKRKKIAEDYSVEVVIDICGKQIKTKGLIDSGNRLYDPKTTLPVILLRCMDELGATIKEKGKPCFSGYTTLTGVGGNEHTIAMYRPDKAEFVGQKTTFVTKSDFLVGLCDFDFGGKSEYGAIVHPAIFGGVK